MKITKHNYEAYFLDYTEGNLSAEDKRELALFLEQNPGLKNELEEYEAVSLTANNVLFEGKEHLKKSVYTDETLVAYLENDLSPKERTELEKDITKHPYLKQEIDLYKKTILVPNETIVYEHKEKLKKRRLVVIWNTPANYLRVAAALLLLAGLFFVTTKLISKKPEAILAKKAETVIQKNTTTINNTNLTPATNVQNGLIASKEQPKYAIKKKGNYATKNDSLNRNINTVQVKYSLKDSTDKNNTIQNNLVQNNTTKDSTASQPFVAIQDSNQSYFYHSTNTEESTDVTENKTAPTKTKKSFFKFLSFAAKGAKQFGIKRIDVKEETNQNIIQIGSLALSETTSN